ncbi:hypothetical protein SBA4_5300005 [Candidatus Sulfopaludibacter sp. SbA4]|nr:hypothetical protein SBA4_5300005 [Candidatus Sulfopaludibacter sp. SbA4]
MGVVPPQFAATAGAARITVRNRGGASSNAVTFTSLAKPAKIAKKTSPASENPEIIAEGSGRTRNWKSSSVIGPLSGSWSRKTGVNRSRRRAYHGRSPKFSENT